MKEIVSIVVTENITRFKTSFKPPIQLDKKKDQYGDVFPNIDNSNNCFPYTPGE